MPEDDISKQDTEEMSVIKLGTFSPEQLLPIAYQTLIHVVPQAIGQTKLALEMSHSEKDASRSEEDAYIAAWLREALEKTESQLEALRKTVSPYIVAYATEPDRGQEVHYLQFVGSDQRLDTGEEVPNGASRKTDVLEVKDFEVLLGKSLREGVHQVATAVEAYASMLPNSEVVKAAELMNRSIITTQNVLLNHGANLETQVAVVSLQGQTVLHF